MAKRQDIKLFEEKKVRSVWDDEQEKLFRLILSIPSPKAEPFKQWMAHVASQRLDQMQDPELSIEQAMQDYKRLGYSDRSSHPLVQNTFSMVGRKKVSCPIIQK